MKKKILQIKYKQFRDLCLRLLKMKTRRSRGQGAKIKSLTQKVKQLFAELKGQVSYAHLLKVPGAALVCLGMTFAQQAQGQITFADPAINPFNLNITQDDTAVLKLVDIDGDGDFDIMAAEYDNTSFYENTGTATNPVFAPKVISPFGLTSSNGYTLVSDFSDLDNDGDLDMISMQDDQSLFYFQNIGTATAPEFATPVANPFGLVPPNNDYSLPVFVDLDGDGDIDLFTANYGSFNYFENTGTPEAPQFATRVSNPFGLTAEEDTYSFPAFVDLDNDGDMDIFAGEYYNGIRYYENTGTAQAPSFAAAIADPFGIAPTQEEVIVFPTFADLDSDGDEDLLTAEYYDNTTVVYYENVTVISSVTEVPADLTLSVFPNPTTDRLTVQSNYDLENVEVFNILGQSVLREKGNVNSISLENLPDGMYEVRMELEQGGFAIEKVFKRS